MSRFSVRIGRTIIATVAVVAAFGVTCGAASAAPSTCEDRVIEYPFVPWNDLAGYFLIPDGGFESSVTPWTLTGGAKIVRGNEPYYVHSSRDVRSLYLPAGSSAMSARLCVTDDDPILRLFVQNKGSATATLQVDVLYRDALGVNQAVPVSAITAGSAWAPTAQIHYLLDLSSVISLDSATKVQFRFTPLGGDWRIDDVYVDPLIWR